MTPPELRALIRDGADDRPMSPGQRGLLVSALNSVFEGDEHRHIALEYLTGHASITTVPLRMLNALWDWVRPGRADGQTLVGAAGWQDGKQLLNLLIPKLI